MPIFTIPIHEHGDPDRMGPYPHAGKKGHVGTKLRRLDRRRVERISKRRQRAWARAADRPRRAEQVMQQLDVEMQRVGGDIGRALTLRRRMDVAAPHVVRARRTSFLGTLKPHRPWPWRRRRSQ